MLQTVNTFLRVKLLKFRCIVQRSFSLYSTYLLVVFSTFRNTAFIFTNEYCLNFSLSHVLMLAALIAAFTKHPPLHSIDTVSAPQTHRPTYQSSFMLFLFLNINKAELHPSPQDFVESLSLTVKINLNEFGLILTMFL